MNPQKELRRWLLTNDRHTLLDISSVEKKAGVSGGTLQRFINGKGIYYSTLLKLIPVFNLLGFISPEIKSDED